MTPPVANIGVFKPAPRILSPKITALSSSTTNQGKTTTTTTTAYTTQAPTAPTSLPKTVAASTTGTVRTTQLSVVDARYGEPNDDFSASSFSRSQPPDPDDEPQPNSTQLNTPLIRHLTKFARSFTRERLDKRIDENIRKIDSAIQHLTTEMKGQVNQNLGPTT
eukprot:gene7161-14577_t